MFVTQATELATYFREQADPDGNRCWRSKGPRLILYLEYHLECAARLQELTELQNDPLFPPVKFHIQWVRDKLLNGWRFGPKKQFVEDTSMFDSIYHTSGLNS